MRGRRAAPQSSLRRGPPCALPHRPEARTPRYPARAARSHADWEKPPRPTATFGPADHHGVSTEPREAPATRVLCIHQRPVRAGSPSPPRRPDVTGRRAPAGGRGSAGRRPAASRDSPAGWRRGRTLLGVAHATREPNPPGCALSHRGVGGTTLSGDRLMIFNYVRSSSIRSDGRQRRLPSDRGIVRPALRRARRLRPRPG
jgi:hypothetical protein